MRGKVDTKSFTFEISTKKVGKLTLMMTVSVFMNSVVMMSNDFLTFRLLAQITL